MDREKAKDILEKLRRRTIERGATPAEAVQAARLAEHLMRRYGLRDESQDSSESFELRERRPPNYALWLALDIATRFSVQATWDVPRGRGTRITFRGPEHAVRVAGWLFAAIANDIGNQATSEARKLGRKGPAPTKFRRHFRESAALAIGERLNPEVHARRRAEWDAKIEENKQAGRECKLSAKMLKMINSIDSNATAAGRKAGDTISIDTNVLPDNCRQPVAMLEAPR